MIPSSEVPADHTFCIFRVKDGRSRKEQERERERKNKRERERTREREREKEREASSFFGWFSSHTHGSGMIVVFDDPFEFERVRDENLEL